MVGSVLGCDCRRGKGALGRGMETLSAWGADPFVAGGAAKAATARGVVTAPVTGVTAAGCHGGTTPGWASSGAGAGTVAAVLAAVGA